MCVSRNSLPIPSVLAPAPVHIHLTEGHSDRTHRKTSRSQDERPSNHETCLCSSQKYPPKIPVPSGNKHAAPVSRGGRLMASLMLPHQSAHMRYASLQNMLLCSGVFLSQTRTRFSSSSYSMSEINWCCWSNYLLSGSASSVLQHSGSGRVAVGYRLFSRERQRVGAEAGKSCLVWRFGGMADFISQTVSKQKITGFALFITKCATKR